jgi:hypothetical protein
MVVFVRLPGHDLVAVPVQRVDGYSDAAEYGRVWEDLTLLDLYVP